jgi:hypothetical protein
MVVDIMTSQVSANALTSGTQIKYFLEANTAYNIRKFTLRFQLTVANPIDLPNVPYWFDRIEFYDRSTNVEIGRIYNDVLNMWANRSDKDVLTSSYNRRLNQNNSYGVRGAEGIPITNTKAGTYYYYLPLNYCFMEGMDLNLYRLQGDIEIRMHPILSY